jgi:hypothetical protein
MSELQIFAPPRANQSAMIDFGLVALTEAIAQLAPDVVGGGCLGGEFGYGANYENDVFTMRTFYWGDCDCGAEEREEVWGAANKHAPDCYQEELHRLQSAMDKYREGINAAIRHRDSKTRYGSSANDSAQKEVERLCDVERKHRDTIYRTLCDAYRIPWAGGRGCAVHCTCGHDKLFHAWIKDNGHTKTCALEAHRP